MRSKLLKYHDGGMAADGGKWVIMLFSSSLIWEEWIVQATCTCATSDSSSVSVDRADVAIVETPLAFLFL